jgi:hypothetical protein
MDKGQEHHIEFLETGEDPAKALESAKEALDLVTAAVQGTVVLPGDEAIPFGRNDGEVANIKGLWAGFVAFIGAVHK